MKRAFVFFSLAALAAPVLAQQEAAEVTKTPQADSKEAHVRVIAQPGLFKAPVVTRPLKIAVYTGGGAGEGNANLLVTAGNRLAGAECIKLAPEDYSKVDLAQFDILVFAGGSGSKQAAALGETGRAAIRDYVQKGGGYLGICAGAYLATAGYPWSLGILDAKTRSTKWARGGGAVSLELTDDAKAIFGVSGEKFPIRYNNGPVIEPFNSPDIPDYKVAAYFRDELAENGTPAGLMKDSPAMAYGTFGKGKVMAISPHAEGTKNLENLLPDVLAWLGDKTPAK